MSLQIRADERLTASDSENRTSNQCTEPLQGSAEYAPVSCRSDKIRSNPAAPHVTLRSWDPCPKSRNNIHVCSCRVKFLQTRLIRTALLIKSSLILDNSDFTVKIYPLQLVEHKLNYPRRFTSPSSRTDQWKRNRTVTRRLCQGHGIFYRLSN